MAVIEETDEGVGRITDKLGSSACPPAPPFGADIQVFGPGAFLQAAHQGGVAQAESLQFPLGSVEAGQQLLAGRCRNRRVDGVALLLQLVEFRLSCGDGKFQHLVAPGGPQAGERSVHRVGLSIILESGFRNEGAIGDNHPVGQQGQGTHGAPQATGEGRDGEQARVALLGFVHPGDGSLRRRHGHVRGDHLRCFFFLGQVQDGVDLGLAGQTEPEPPFSQRIRFPDLVTG